VAARLLIAAVLLVIAALAAWVLEARRRRARHPVRVGSELTSVHRADFARPDAPWLALLFTSRDCAGCEPMRARLAPLESDRLAVDVCEYHDQRGLHERYAIDSVPYLVLADADGVVRASFLGTVSADELWTQIHTLTG
jgi:hypothetical protein